MVSGWKGNRWEPKLGNRGRPSRKRINGSGKRSRRMERDEQRGLDQSPKRQPTPGLSLAKIRLVRAGSAALAEAACRGWRVLRLRNSWRETTEGREPFRRRPIDSCCSTSPLVPSCPSSSLVSRAPFEHSPLPFLFRSLSSVAGTAFYFNNVAGTVPRWTNAGVSGPYHPRWNLRYGAATPFVSFSTGLLCTASSHTLSPLDPWMGTRGRIVLWMADECVLWDVWEMTMLPVEWVVQGFHDFEWSRKIRFEKLALDLLYRW